jgi:hypothetical protein
MRRIVLACVLVSGCGSSGDASSGAGGGDGGGDAGDAGAVADVRADAPGVPTGPGDGAFQKAFRDGGVGVTCDMTFDALVKSGAPSITRGKTTLFVGFQQIGVNQDPVFARFDDGVKVYCERHEKESPDGRAVGLTWDGGPTAWVVYTIVGGGSAFDGLAKGAWIDRYGDGGGSSKVSVIGEVDTQLGTVRRVTFVPAKRQDGTKTNTLVPADAITVLTDGTLEFKGGAAFAPLNPDRTPMCLGSTEYPAALDGGKGPSYVARFSADLRSVVCASTAGCSVVKQPCK